MNPFANTDYNKWIADWKGQTIAQDATDLERADRLRERVRGLAAAGPFGILLIADGTYTYRLLNHQGRVLEAGDGRDRTLLKGTYPPGVALAEITQGNRCRVFPVAQP